MCDVTRIDAPNFLTVTGSDWSDIHKPDGHLVMIGQRTFQVQRR